MTRRDWFWPMAYLRLFAFCAALAAFGYCTGCAGSSPIAKAAEAYGYAVFATEAAADIVENEAIDRDLRRAVQVAERYSTPASQALKEAAISAVAVKAALDQGLATRAEWDAAVDLIFERLDALRVPLTDLFEAIGKAR